MNRTCKRFLQVASLLPFLLGMTGDDLQKRIDAMPKMDGVHPSQGGVIRLDGARISPKWKITTSKPIQVWSHVTVDFGGVELIYTGPADRAAVEFANRHEHGYHVGGRIENFKITSSGKGVGISPSVLYDTQNVTVRDGWIIPAKDAIDLRSPLATYRARVENVTVREPGAAVLRINGNGNVIEGLWLSSVVRDKFETDALVTLEGYGAWRDGLLELFTGPKTMAVLVKGDWLIERLWTEGQIGPHIVADGAGATARVVDPALVAQEPVVAKNGAKVLFEQSSKVFPTSLLKSESGGTITSDTQQQEPSR